MQLQTCGHKAQAKCMPVELRPSAMGGERRGLATRPTAPVIFQGKDPEQIDVELFGNGEDS